jgi:coenzyme Q-binding protein COQ10
MPRFETKHRVAFTAEQMYALVADVERYPEFLPMCTGLKVASRSPASDGGEELTARMSVGYKQIAESFVTRVTLHPAERRSEVRYLDGPFKYLENRWQFEDDGAGAIVHFYISYEFKSPVLGLLMGALFDKAFRKFTDAFDDRARAVYGKAASPVPTA